MIRFLDLTAKPTLERVRDLFINGITSAPLSNQKMNQYMKIICQLAGITSKRSIVDLILPKAGKVGLAENSDIGKSSFFRYLAMNIDSGNDKFHYKKIKYKPV